MNKRFFWKSFSLIQSGIAFENEIKPLGANATYVSSNLSNFKNHSLIFVISKDAKCKLTNYDSKIIEDKNDKNHKDVILDYTFKCKKINELYFIDFTAFKTFNDLEDYLDFCVKEPID